MTQKHRVLWIEDGARYDLADMAAPVYMDGKYDLIIAEDASSGIDYLLGNVFDVIIVDIRIPPGGDKKWIKLHQNSSADKISGRLGLELLRTILGHQDAKIILGDRRPTWITPNRIGILTVENERELDVHLKKLQISVYHQKRARRQWRYYSNLFRKY